MNQNQILLKELYQLKMKVNNIIDLVHSNMREKNEEFTIKNKYDFYSDSDTEKEIDVDDISNSSKESTEELINTMPNFMNTIIDKTNESSMNPIIHNNVPWVPPKNIHNKHK